MTATYKVDVDDELSVDILQSIKEAFKGKTVDIVVTESIDEVMDETEYLLSSQANKESLMKSIKEIEEGKGITFTIEELRERYGIK